MVRIEFNSRSLPGNAINKVFWLVLLQQPARVKLDTNLNHVYGTEALEYYFATKYYSYLYMMVKQLFKIIDLLLSSKKCVQFNKLHVQLVKNETQLSVLILGIDDIYFLSGFFQLLIFFYDNFIIIYIAYS